jgi:hypothetical protein
MSLDVNDLIQALENENNTNVAGLSSAVMKKMKNDILQKLQLSGGELKQYHKVLKDYKYVDELNELQVGRFIRWIRLDKDTTDIKLVNGAVLVNILVNRGGRGGRRNVALKFDNCLIFQKLSDQEKILVSAIDYLEKN